MIKYVVGFVFDHEYKRVVLIRKLRPNFLKGKLNGIGGKIEPGETGIKAVRREFMEEAGLDIPHWNYYWTDNGSGYSVDFYFATADVSAVQTKTDEDIVVVDGVFGAYWEIAGAPVEEDETAPNIDWLISEIVNLHKQGKI